MANNHGYTDAELNAADAEMDGFDESLMFVGGHLAADEMPAPITLTAAEAERFVDLLANPPRPTAALVALLRRRPATSAAEER
jgi:hypothetical protein